MFFCLLLFEDTLISFFKDKGIVDSVTHLHIKLELNVVVYFCLSFFGLVYYRGRKATNQIKANRVKDGVSEPYWIRIHSSP